MRRETQGTRWTILLALLLAFVLCGSVVLPTTARADEKTETTAEQLAADATKTGDAAKADDAAATTTGAEVDAAATTDAAASDLPGNATAMGNDVLWSDDSARFAGTVANDLLGCGDVLGVSEAQIAGSVRLAARYITLDNATVGESITIAGQELTITGGSSNVAALAGETLTFRSETGELYLAGRTVLIDGVVKGDVHVAARSLELGPNARIDGTLKGTLGEDPKIDANAVIGGNELTVDQDEPEEPADLFDWRVIAASAASCLLIALLIEWLAGGLSEGGASIIKERPGAYLLWSILGIIVAPLVCILIALPIVTIPASIAGILVLCAIGLVSAGLMAAILGRLVAPKANRFLMAAIFGLILGVATAMPYAGLPLRGVCYALSLGYVLCSLRKGMTERRERRAEEAVRF